MKRIISILLTLLSFGAMAQHGNFTDIRLINGSAGLAGTNNGGFYFDTGLGKFQFRQGGAWMELGSISGLTTNTLPYATSATTIASSTMTWNNGTNTIGNAGSLTLLPTANLVLSSLSNVNISASGNIVSITKHFFTPTSTLSGFNLGNIAGNPSSLANFDIWGNSSTGAITTHLLGTTREILNQPTSGIPQNYVAIGSSVNSTLNGDADLTFVGATNTLSSPRFQGASTATLASLNLGSLAGNPSSLGNADVWYNSTSSTLNGRISGATREILNQPVSGIPINNIAIGSSINSTLSSDANLTYSTNTLFTPNATITTALKNTALTSGRVATIGTAGLFQDDADLTFSGSTLSATNITVATNLTVSSLTSGRAPYISTSGLITNEDAYLYDATSNVLTIGNSATSTGSTISLLGDISGVDNSLTFESTVLAGAGLPNCSKITSAILPLAVVIPVGSYLILVNLPTTCAGAPTGAVANIAGILNICP